MMGKLRARDHNDAYADAGVDIDAGHDVLRRIEKAVRSTWDANVLGEFGAFSGLYDLSGRAGQDGVLAVTIDGVGTKLKVAAMCGRYASVGMDLVHHCTNDLLVQRARPIVFSDYVASARLDPGIVAEIVGGIANACGGVGCCLIAGETAEMPGIYVDREFDLVGCMVGVARRADIAGAPAVAPGDVLIGIESSGLHTNGYSLARRLLFEKAGLGVETNVRELGRTVGEELLEVHRQYLTVLEPYTGDPRVHAMAHITGGGIFDNLLRIVPEGCEARVEKASWDPNPIFKMLCRLGDLSDEDAYRTFNMGIGMIVVAGRDGVDELVKALSSDEAAAIVVGEVTSGQRRVVLV